MKSSNILFDRYRERENETDLFDRKKDLYKLFEYMDHLILQPKDNKYEYAFFFFPGFNENAGKYVNLLKPFFENFSKVSKIKFKIILPMMKKAQRNMYPHSNFINYKDARYEYVHTWYKLYYDENKIRNGFETFKDIDEFIKKLIFKELKKLGNEEKLIFSGFSMGGRYLTNLLENINIRTKFNILFKSPITMYNIKNEKNIVKNKTSLKKWNYSSMDKELLRKGNYLKNKYYLFYSIYDKLLPVTEGLVTYDLIKNEFSYVKIKVDSGKKHIVDYNCLEYLKETLMKEILPKKANF